MTRHPPRLRFRRADPATVIEDELQAELDEIGVELEAETLLAEVDKVERELAAIAADVRNIEAADEEQRCDCASCRSAPAALVAAAQVGADGEVHRLLLPAPTPIVAGGAPRRRPKYPRLRVRPHQRQVLTASGEPHPDVTWPMVEAAIARQELGVIRRREALAASAASSSPSRGLVAAAQPQEGDVEVSVRAGGIVGLLSRLVDGVTELAGRESSAPPVVHVHVPEPPPPQRTRAIPVRDENQRIVAVDHVPVEDDE